MMAGLAIGVGHIVFAVVITVVVSVVLLILSKSKFGEESVNEKKLKIVIPEDLDYSEVFDDIFSKYTNKIVMEKVKTINSGSMYELNYAVVLKPEQKEKSFIDELRCRNGNLAITLSRELTSSSELL